MNVPMLLFFKKVYGKILPQKIRKKLNLGRKLHVDENIIKTLPEYDYGYIELNHTKIRLCLKDFVQRGIYLTGYHEKDECFALLDLFPENGVFLDIGANIGVYSFVFYKKARHIYAFEATKKHLTAYVKQ